MKKKVSLFLLSLVFLGFSSFKHPFYLSVTDIKYNSKEKAIQGSVKVFVNDLESALENIYKEQIDLINVKDSTKAMKVVSEYLKKRLVLFVNDKKTEFAVLGFENEMEGIWIYIECKSPLPKKIRVENSILCDFLKEQSNIVHVEVGDQRKSLKVNCPEKVLIFDF